MSALALALSEWPKWNRLFAAGSATLGAMTTQTIPEYLEEERQKTADTQLRTEKEAARIEPLQHGHHRNSKQSKPELELVPPFKAATKRKQRAKRKPQAKRQTKKQKREASPWSLPRSHAPREGRQRKPANGLDSDVLVASTATNTGTRLRCKFRPSPLFSRWLTPDRRVRFRSDRVKQKTPQTIQI